MNSYVIYLFVLTTFVALSCADNAASENEWVTNAQANIDACAKLCKPESATCPIDCANIPKVGSPKHKSRLHGWNDIFQRAGFKVLHPKKKMIPLPPNLPVSPNPSTRALSENSEFFAYGFRKDDVVFQKDGPAASDVSQAQQPNCQFMAVLAALANTDMGRNRLTNNIRVTKDNNFAVTFYRPKDETIYASHSDSDSGKKFDQMFAAETIEITPDLPEEKENAGAKVLRTFPHRVVKNGKSAVWPILYNKALVAWLEAGKFEEPDLVKQILPLSNAKNSFYRIGPNIPGSFTMAALLGKPTVMLKTKKLTRQQHMQFAKLATWYPIMLGSRKSFKSRTIPYLLGWSKVYRSHAYTLMGIDEKGLVHIQNPWGKQGKINVLGTTHKVPLNRDIHINAKEFQKRFASMILPREAAEKILGKHIEKFIIKV